MITIENVRITYHEDYDADISWLDQTDAQMGDGFEQHANERKTSYGGEWSMIGIRAECTVLIPHGDHFITQPISSPGLWGIESDSGQEYFNIIANEELDTLRDIVIELGATDVSAIEEVRPA